MLTVTNNGWNILSERPSDTAATFVASELNRARSDLDFTFALDFDFAFDLDLALDSSKP